ncbi:MAG: hypothetical protein ABWX92_07075 [Mycetocola sp.]
MTDPNEITLDNRAVTLENTYSEGVLKKARKLAATEGAVFRNEEDENEWLVAGSGGNFYHVEILPLVVEQEDSDTYTDEELEFLGLSATPESIDIIDDLPWVRCECPNGSHRGGRPSCYHSAAVIITLQKEADDRKNR